jgi:hypothetical protein
LTLTPAENARLLGWVVHVLSWAGLTGDERRFLIGVQGQLKRRPGMVLSEKQAPWLSRIVARFQRETLSGDDVVEQDREAGC